MGTQVFQTLFDKIEASHLREKKKKSNKLENMLLNSCSILETRKLLKVTKLHIIKYSVYTRSCLSVLLTPFGHM